MGWRALFSGRGDPKSVTPTVSGVRFQEPDPNNIDRHRERSCQVDLVSLVRSVEEMRKNPQTSNVVLGLNKDVVIGTQGGNQACKRGLFGLACPADPQFSSDPEAAAYCHRQIISAGKKAGFKLREEVPEYNPGSGFKGLAEWADRVRWQRVRPKLPLWLLLLPLLFLPILVLCHRGSQPEVLWQGGRYRQRNYPAGQERQHGR